MTTELHTTPINDPLIEVHNWSLNLLVKSFTDRFEGIGTFPAQLTIHTNPNIPPVIHAARRVPIHIRTQVADEL